jgi:hypothetical protein
MRLRRRTSRTPTRNRSGFKGPRHDTKTVRNERRGTRLFRFPVCHSETNARNSQRSRIRTTASDAKTCAFGFARCRCRLRWRRISRRGLNALLTRPRAHSTLNRHRRPAFASLRYSPQASYSALGNRSDLSVDLVTKKPPNRRCRHPWSPTEGFRHDPTVCGVILKIPYKGEWSSTPSPRQLDSSSFKAPSFGARLTRCRAFVVGLKRPPTHTQTLAVTSTCSCVPHTPPSLAADSSRKIIAACPQVSR